MHGVAVADILDRDPSPGDAPASMCDLRLFGNQFSPFSDVWDATQGFSHARQVLCH